MTINLTNAELVQQLAYQFAIYNQWPTDNTVLDALPTEQKHLYSSSKKMYKAILAEARVKLGKEKTDAILKEASAILKQAHETAD